MAAARHFESGDGPGNELAELLPVHSFPRYTPSQITNLKTVGQRPNVHCGNNQDGLDPIYLFILFVFEQVICWRGVGWLMFSEQVFYSSSKLGNNFFVGFSI